MEFKKAENFAKKIAELAEEDGLTISELREAAYLAKRIANESQVKSAGMEKAFPVRKSGEYSRGTFDRR